MRRALYWLRIWLIAKDFERGSFPWERPVSRLLAKVAP